ncbi:hypothetical protein QQP08_025480 [Theobroma cacao]|nr:hypothetical protein QQP08_025480 [Theobroma cacao]
MTLIRFILALSIVTLLLFSRSLPTSAAADQDGGGVLIPFSRLLLSQPVKAGEKRGDDDDFVSSVPKKFRIHMRKVRGGGVATRARGRTSSAVRTQFSSFHLASFLGCSLFLGLMML